jgi:hypothetical protein
MNTIDRLVAQAQIGLAFFYGAVFVAMFVCLAIFWERLTKFDVGLLTMFATGAMNQSKDAGTFFFARHRAQSSPDDDSTPGTISAPLQKPTETKP